MYRGAGNGARRFVAEAFGSRVEGDVLFRTKTVAGTRGRMGYGSLMQSRTHRDRKAIRLAKVRQSRQMREAARNTVAVWGDGI